MRAERQPPGRGERPARGAWEKSCNSWEILVQAGTQPGLRRGGQPGLGDNALLHQAIGKLDRAEGKCDHRQSDYRQHSVQENLNFY